MTEVAFSGLRLNSPTTDDADFPDAEVPTFTRIGRFTSNRTGSDHYLSLQEAPFTRCGVIRRLGNQSPSRVTNIFRGNLAKHLREQTGIQNVWSRGFFVRSVGNVTADAIRQYASSQYQRHRAEPEHDPEFGPLARFHNSVDTSQIRRDSHSAYEYNIHIVIVTQKRKEFLDVTVAEELVRYWRSVCHKKRWVPWDIEVVSDHAHCWSDCGPKTIVSALP